MNQGQGQGVRTRQTENSLLLRTRRRITVFLSFFQWVGSCVRNGISAKMLVVYTCNFVSSIDRQISFTVRRIILTAGQSLFDMEVRLGMS